jgi:hypothetical protein
MPSQSQQVGGETSAQRLVVVAFSSPNWPYKRDAATRRHKGHERLQDQGRRLT